MIWIALAWATAVALPPHIHLTNEACEEVPAQPGQPLRFAFALPSLSGPGGGPTMSHTDTARPEELQLRLEGCGAETAPWRALDLTCHGVPVLEWTGEVQPGGRYRIERSPYPHDEPLLTFRTPGTRRAACAEPPFEPYDDRHEVTTDLSITLPPGTLHVRDGSTLIPPSLLDELAGGPSRAAPGTIGTPDLLEDGRAQGTWTETLTTARRDEPRLRSSVVCRQTLTRTATLSIPGTEPFRTWREVVRELPGSCRDHAVETHDELRAAVEARANAALANQSPRLDCATSPTDLRSRVLCSAARGQTLDRRTLRKVVAGLPGERDEDVLEALIAVTRPEHLDRIASFFADLAPDDPVGAHWAWAQLQQSEAYRADPIASLTAANLRHPGAAMDLARHHRAAGELQAAAFVAFHAYPSPRPLEAVDSIRWALEVSAEEHQACLSAPSPAPATQRGCYQNQQEGQARAAELVRFLPGDEEARGWSDVLAQPLP